MGGSVYFCWPQPDGANQVDVVITGPEFRTSFYLKGVAVVGSDLESEAKCNFQVTLNNNLKKTSNLTQLRLKSLFTNNAPEFTTSFIRIGRLKKNAGDENPTNSFMELGQAPR